MTLTKMTKSAILPIYTDKLTKHIMHFCMEHANLRSEDFPGKIPCIST